MKASNKDTLEVIESIPRLVQTINTLKSLPNEILNQKLTTNEIDLLRKINIKQDKCSPIPKTNVFESEIQAIEIVDGILIFALYMEQLMNRYPSISIGDIIQIKVREYIDLRNNKTLTSFKSNRQYTPSTINFSITDFNWESNLGKARVTGPVAKLLLIDEANIIHEHSIGNIGSRIGINIHEVYILK